MTLEFGHWKRRSQKPLQFLFPLYSTFLMINYYPQRSVRPVITFWPPVTFKEKSRVLTWHILYSKRRTTTPQEKPTRNNPPGISLPNTRVNIFLRLFLIHFRTCTSEICMLSFIVVDIKCCVIAFVVIGCLEVFDRLFSLSCFIFVMIFIFLGNHCTYIYWNFVHTIW